MTDAAHHLYRETQAAKTLRANLADVIGSDEPFAAEIVEAETNLNEAIELAVQQIADDMASIKGLTDYIEKFTARRERLRERIDNMRTALAVAMEQAGRKRIEHPAVTMSLRPAAPSVTVTDEAAIPSRFWVSPEPRLNKRALLAALKDKETVPGAALSNGGSCLTLTWS
jgi:Siphovirus Gp157